MNMHYFGQNRIDSGSISLHPRSMATLTKSRVRSARPRARKYELACDQCKGLRLRVLPSGKKVFVVRVFACGRDKRARLGTTEELTLAEARRRAREFVAALKQTQTSAREPTAPPTPAAPRTPSASTPSTVATPILFEHLVARYRELHIPQLSKGSRMNYEGVIRNLLKRWRGRPIVEIRVADVESVHRAMRATPSAANNYMRVLHHMFERAARWDMFPREFRNPVAGLRYYREQGRERYLSPQERARLRRVLRAAEKKPDGRRGHLRWSTIAAIELLELTGCRSKEILDLQWSWVDWANGLILFPTTKTGRDARIVSDDVLEYLRRLEPRRVPGCPYVLYSKTKRKVSRSSLGDAWRRIRRLAGINDVRLHDLRHSAASDAIRSGATLFVVSKILGHANPKTTARYAHLTQEQAREAANAMTTMILAKPRRRRRRKS